MTDPAYCDQFVELKKFFKFIVGISISNAPVERNVAILNVVKTERRGRIEQPLLNQLVRIKLNTPSAGCLNSEMSRTVAVQFLYGDKQRRQCTTKLDTFKYNAGDPAISSEDLHKPTKRIRLPEPYNVNPALPEQFPQAVKHPKLIQAGLPMTIKQEGTSSCYFMPRQKQPPPHTPVHMEINDDLTEEEASIIRAQIVEDDLSHTPDEGRPIRPDILDDHNKFMVDYSGIVQCAFGVNFRLLNNLVHGNKEKSIAGLDFQRSDLKRMLSSKMYRDNSLQMYNKVLQRCGKGCDVPKRVFFVPMYWCPALSTPNFTKDFLEHLPDLDSFDLVQWKINIGNWHWVSVYHSPAPGATLFYWDSLGSTQERLARMTDVMAGTINKVADKLGRKWYWNQQSTQVEGETVFEQCSSLICSPHSEMAAMTVVLL